MNNPKPTVQVADGRTFVGQWPHLIAENHESAAADQLAELVGGVREVNVPAGRVDVMTSTTVYEVELAAAWRQGLRQSLAYAQATGCVPGLALFGQANFRMIQAWLEEHLPAVELWRWNADGWSRLTADDFPEEVEVAATPRPARLAAAYSERPPRPAPVDGGQDQGLAINDPVALNRAAQIVRRAMMRQRASQEMV